MPIAINHNQLQPRHIRHVMKRTTKKIEPKLLKAGKIYLFKWKSAIEILFENNFHFDLLQIFDSYWIHWEHKFLVEIEAIGLRDFAFAIRMIFRAGNHFCSFH